MTATRQKLVDLALIVLQAAVALAVIWFALGCSSTKSIPTSSDAQVSANAVSAKGGTIACATQLSATLDPATGNVTSLTCASNAAWTDPPTAEETTALGEFGQAILDVFAIPFRLLAAVGGAVQP